MSSTATQTSTSTYTSADVENVVRRLTADLIMIASSTGAISEKDAREYGHDIEVLAKAGFLKSIDVTLLSGSVEKCAATYSVLIGHDDLVSSRPGDVMWPKVSDPDLRIILFCTDKYTAEQKSAYRNKLKIDWSPSDADTSHSKLSGSAARDYTSNGFGMSRKDFK